MSTWLLRAASFALLLLASSAFAQAAPPDTPQSETSEQAAPPDHAGPDRSGPLPLMVVVIPNRRVSAESASAAGAAALEQVRAMAGRRPVHLVGAEALVTTLSGCGDDDCIGAQLASAGVQAGVFVRLRRRGRRLAATLEVRDPVSGALRGEAVSGSIPTAGEEIAEALSPLIQQLEASMPPPPPPPAMLLVTVNVDGAQVRIDDEEVGTAPVAAHEVSGGPHTVSVELAGYLPVMRRTEVAAGEQGRVDVTLRPLGSEVTRSAAATSGENVWVEGTEAPPAATQAEGDGELLEQWWFWTAVGGGAAVVLAVAIGLGVGLSGQEEPLPPMGIELPRIEGGL